MAIQINEKHLSSKAKKALNNAKNKSQFLRDAIEFYVNRESVYENIGSDLKEDVREIKELLLKMSIPPLITETAITKESFLTSQSPKSSVQDSSKEIEIDKLKEYAASEVKVEEAINDDGLSEAKKKEIAEMLDNSIDLF